MKRVNGGLRPAYIGQKKEDECCGDAVVETDGGIGGYGGRECLRSLTLKMVGGWVI